jgi:predicted metalloprotease with PDZ domain
VSKETKPEIELHKEPDATEFFEFKMARWAPWEWMVYEFEQGLSRSPIPVWPKPKPGK